MRLRFLLLAALLVAGPVAAQDSTPSSPEASSSPAADAPSVDLRTARTTELPVSVDRIREQLAKTPPVPILRGLNEQPTFRSGVEEHLKIEDFFRPEDFEVGPVPPGGLYAHEMQRVLADPTREPLGQPYAAFSGGELATIAIESLIFKILGQRLTQAFVNSSDAAAQAQAEAEVARAIAQYCAAQPGGGAGIAICRNRIGPR